MIQQITSTGGMGTIHIVLTKWCNQGCKGCNQSIEDRNNTNSNLKLTSFIKKEIIMLFKFYELNNKSINISFFGGEPLTQHKTIIEIIEWLGTEKLNPAQISIPTSGGKNQSLIKYVPDIIEAIQRSFVWDEKPKFILSQSYDGPNNEELRNSSKEEIQKSIWYIDEFKYNNNFSENHFKPKYTSCLIPQIITEDYFIDTYKDVLEVTGRIPNFRIPYLIHEDSNLDTIVFKNAIEKFLNYLIENSGNFVIKNSKDYAKMYMVNKVIKDEYLDNPIIPKLFSDTIRLLCKDLPTEFNWCQAGVSHYAIDANGLVENGCEYLDKPASELHAKMMEHCNKCEIKDHCMKPCLKNMEESDLTIKSFFRQCTIRKILLNQIIKTLKG